MEETHRAGILFKVQGAISEHEGPREQNLLKDGKDGDDDDQMERQSRTEL